MQTSFMERAQHLGALLSEYEESQKENLENITLEEDEDLEELERLTQPDPIPEPPQLKTVEKIKAPFYPAKKEDAPTPTVEATPKEEVKKMETPTNIRSAISIILNSLESDKEGLLKELALNNPVSLRALSNLSKDAANESHERALKEHAELLSTDGVSLEELALHLGYKLVKEDEKPTPAKQAPRNNGNVPRKLTQAEIKTLTDLIQKGLKFKDVQKEMQRMYGRLVSNSKFYTFRAELNKKQVESNLLTK